MSAMFNGIPIHINALATNRVYRVERMPIKKRRKAYRVRAHQVPGCWEVAGFGLVMHPALYEKMRNVVGAV